MRLFHKGWKTVARPSIQTENFFQVKTTCGDRASQMRETQFEVTAQKYQVEKAIWRCVRALETCAIQFHLCGFNWGFWQFSLLLSHFTHGNFLRVTVLRRGLLRYSRTAQTKRIVRFHHLIYGML